MASVKRPQPRIRLHSSHSQQHLVLSSKSPIVNSRPRITRSSSSATLRIVSPGVLLLQDPLQDPMAKALSTPMVSQSSQTFKLERDRQPSTVPCYTGKLVQNYKYTLQSNY